MGFFIYLSLYPSMALSMGITLVTPILWMAVANYRLG